MDSASRLTVTLLVCLAVVFPSAAVEKPVRFQGHEVHPTRLIARLREAADANTTALVEKSGLHIAHDFDLVPGLVLLDEPNAPAKAAVAIDAATRLKERLRELTASGKFLYVEPDYVVHASELPNDASFTNGALWGLRNTGQDGGVAGADIDAVRAWELSTGSTNVIVAVIDTGIRYTHQDLAAQMWRNPGEILDNGRDDDSDGYVDNVYGINAITGSGNPMDDNDHGTHTAGTIGAAANDGHPHVGVCWKLRLMACKFLDQEGNGSSSDAIKCIQFAVQKGARILNNSWGGGPYSQSMADAIAAAKERGVLFVASAGNAGNNNDLNPTYPAGYEIDSIVAVAAIDREDKLADFSNYGALSVHVAAPGVQILSSTSGSDSEYKTFRGTSMAAPHVSGVAALVAAMFPEIGLAELRQRIIATAVATDGLRGRAASGGRVSAFNALSAVPDGQLDLLISSRAGPYVVGGETAVFLARVTDLYGITNATVTGSVEGLTNLVFRNDGVAPDTRARDAFYAAQCFVPPNLPSLTLRVEVTAPDEANGTNATTFPVLRPPANDRFLNAIPLSGTPVDVAGTNLLASKEAGEPNHGGNRGGTSVWWAWTAPTNGVATVSTAGSGFDTVLGVYSGSQVDQLTSLGQDDDGGPDLTSVVTLDATLGSTYRIAVDGFDGASGCRSPRVWNGPRTTTLRTVSP